MPTHYVHRGLIKKNLAENTLKSFIKSLKRGYGIETDLHVTKDNQLVCFHDFTLKRKFKLNKNVKDTNYINLKKISKKKGTEIPLLEDLLKVSKKKYPLLLEIKPLFKKENLLCLVKLTKNIKKYGLISFKEKNLINLYTLNKKLPLGLLFLSTSSLRTIKSKSKKPHVKFLGLEKSFLSKRKIDLIKKPIYYYTIKNKNLFHRYKDSKNLIFENL